MAKTITFQYSTTVEKSVKALVAAVARLGYSITSADRENGLVTFETGLSLWSWAGQKVSAHVLEIDANRVQVTIGGTMKAHGAQLQFFDWGEAKKIAKRVFDELDSHLGPRC